MGLSRTGVRIGSEDARCDFCGSRMVRWVYPTTERDWFSCEKCRALVEADDREALLNRASLIPVPQSVPERFAPKHLDRAHKLHVEFWESRVGEARRFS